MRLSSNEEKIRLRMPSIVFKCSKLKLHSLMSLEIVMSRNFPEFATVVGL